MGSDKRADEEVCRERKGLRISWFYFKMLLKWVPVGSRIKVTSGGLPCVCARVRAHALAGL